MSNCLDCNLPVFGHGDRHRTCDDVLCSRVLRWENDAEGLLADPITMPFCDDDAINAGAWAGFNFLYGEDGAFDRWVKARLLGSFADLPNAFALAMHYEATASKVFDETAPVVQKATSRRLILEAALNQLLGNSEGVCARIVDAFDAMKHVAAKIRSFQQAAARE